MDPFVSDLISYILLVVLAYGAYSLVLDAVFGFEKLKKLFKRKKKPDKIDWREL